MKSNECNESKKIDKNLLIEIEKRKILISKFLLNLIDNNYI